MNSACLEYILGRELEENQRIVRQDARNETGKRRRQRARAHAGGDFRQPGHSILNGQRGLLGYGVLSINLQVLNNR